MGMEPISDLVTKSDFSHYSLKKNKKSLKSLCCENSYTEQYSTKRNKRNYSENLARTRAEYIAKKLNNPSRFMFYLKCAWNLTDAYLDRLLGVALTKENPICYFSRAASNEMQHNA